MMNKKWKIAFCSAAIATAIALLALVPKAAANAIAAYVVLGTKC